MKNKLDNYREIESTYSVALWLLFQNSSMVEQGAVNTEVIGSSPVFGAFI